MKEQRDDSPRLTHILKAYNVLGVYALKRWIYVGIAVLVGLLVYGLVSMTYTSASKRITVVIDAGHGEIG